MTLALLGVAGLAALAGCGRGWISFEEREAWRHEAEVACLKSGQVKIGTMVAKMEPIEGPGMCGADFPLKVAALGEGPVVGYDEELRPPGSIPNASLPQRWPVNEPPRYQPPPPAYPQQSYPQQSYPQQNYRQQNYPQQSYQPPQSQPAYAPPMRAATTAPAANPMQLHPQDAMQDSDEDDIPDDAILPPGRQPPRPSAPPSYPPANPAQRYTPPALGPARGNVTGSIQPATVSPPATLACPIVSALDLWMSGSVQPAALRWFRQPVVEIKQISAYSCRGMNGQPGAHISEHAFGNALDIAAFVLADGRTVTVKKGWRGTPEEQGFLHDVQGAACDQFNTVLAPGSNVFHYDHIHVDLMRRSSGRKICQPGAIDGQVAAARAQSRMVRRGDPGITGSLAKNARPAEDNDEEAAEATEEAQISPPVRTRRSWGYPQVFTP